MTISNTEAVAALSPQAQQRLLEAIQSGLKLSPVAVERLTLNLDLSVEELVQPTAQVDTEQKPGLLPQIQTKITDLMQLYFPDMPCFSAETLAAVDVIDAS